MVPGASAPADAGVVGAVAGASTLPPRQQQVLALIAAGLAMVEVAEKSGVHRHTIHRWMNHNARFRAAFGAQQGPVEDR